MDTTTNYDASSPLAFLHSGGPESEFNKSSMSLKASSGGDTIRDSESSGEILVRFELDIAYICEKLTNLNLLSMHVETKESEFEAIDSEFDPNLVVKVLEYDLLSGLLDSELRILETHISDLQIEKANVMEFLSSRKHVGEPLIGMDDMLHDSEKSLEQSLEQVLELKVQSANFERNLLRFAGDDTWKYNDYTDSFIDSDPLELKEKMKMQTVEHQRHFLRVLEKSLEREIDLEKRVSELIQIKETLTMRLHLLERDIFYAEEEAERNLEKFYETDHTSDLLMETSKELISKIKMLQFNLKGSVQREAESKSALLKLKEHINEKASTEGILKDTYEKMVSLEKELSDTKVKLVHAEASYEASQEDKSMLVSTIKDMSNVIDDLKNKNKRGVNQIDSVEDKCIFLSESNEDLKKELSFVKGRVKCLETSLHQMEETKKASAKDISLRSKLITDLVMQMALERERLQKQISSLKQENKFLVKHLKKTEEDPAVKVSHGDKASSTDHKLSEIDLTTENKEALSTNFEVEKACNETVMDSTETAVNIEARQLKRKQILLALLVLIVPLFLVLFHQTQVR